MSLIIERTLTLRSTSSPDPQEVLQRIVSILSAAGFRVSQSGPDGYAAVGPGMQSSRGNPLFAFKTIKFGLDSRRAVLLEGDTSGARRLQLFLLLFPLALGVVLAVVFLSLGMSEKFWIPFLAVAPWVVLSPIMARQMSRKTRAALQALLDNAILAARTER